MADKPRNNVANDEQSDQDIDELYSNPVNEIGINMVSNQVNKLTCKYSRL